jgi:hypothetical protein
MDFWRLAQSGGVVHISPAASFRIDGDFFRIFRFFGRFEFPAEPAISVAKVVRYVLFQPSYCLRRESFAMLPFVTLFHAALFFLVAIRRSADARSSHLRATRNVLSLQRSSPFFFATTPGHTHHHEAKARLRNMNPAPTASIYRYNFRKNI